MEGRVSIEYLRRNLSYCPQTGIIKWAARGFCRKFGQEAGHKDQRGYRRIFLCGRNYKAHIVAWALHYGEWPDMWLDHINCVRDDNRLSNLRLVTPLQNIANRRAKRGGTSSLKGVSWNKQRRMWQSSIGVNGNTVYLGYFDTEQAAHEAYWNAARATFGEFARAA